MQTLTSARQAKEFLVSKIVDQAQREGLPLSEVERKMLYFSETGWTLPDMEEVNATFEHNCDQEEYEKKIAAVVRRFRQRAQSESPEELEAWTEAVRILSEEDHYLLVLIDEAGPIRPRGDFVKLLAAAVAIVARILAYMYLTASR